MNHEQPNTLQTTQPPEFTTEQACAFTSAHFGIVASASPLVSYQDQNFHLRADSGEQFVLKISNMLENPELIDLQTRALEHIALTDPALPVPRTIPTRDGQDYFLVRDADEREHVVRLITWLDGSIIEGVDPSDRLLWDMGQTLARLGIALKDFSHPAADHHLPWDLKNTTELFDLLPHIEDPVLRAHVEKTLNRFVENVLPVMASLRSQVIHSDLSRGNVLISTEKPERLTGIIDFGDLVHTPLIMDLGIAAAYHLTDSGDPLDRALHFILGYNKVTPIEAVEADILVDLMTARLCTSITMQMWRVKLFPENREYLMINNRFSQDTLKHINSLDVNVLRQRIVTACGHT